MDIVYNIVKYETLIINREIIRIVIKGRSGDGSVDEADEDKITLLQGTIKYEYVPHQTSNSETNIYRKWFCSTTSQAFSEFDERIVAMMPWLLNTGEIP